MIRDPDQDDYKTYSLVDRLGFACIAGCNCLTKTPDFQYHHSLCNYRLHYEARNALINKTHDNNRT